MQPNFKLKEVNGFTVASRDIDVFPHLFEFRLHDLLRLPETPCPRLELHPEVNTAPEEYHAVRPSFKSPLLATKAPPPDLLGEGAFDVRL